MGGLDGWGRQRRCAGEDPPAARRPTARFPGYFPCLGDRPRRTTTDLTDRILLQRSSRIRSLLLSRAIAAPDPRQSPEEDLCPQRSRITRSSATRKPSPLSTSPDPSTGGA